MAAPGIVFDLEADGLSPTKIHCVSAHDGKLKSTAKYDNMRKLFEKADILVGHNITLFDIPVVERLLGVKVKAKLVDTLALSWYLEPSRLRHGLEGWGEDFGIEKPVVEDWDNLTVDEYIHRCEEDVKINKALWERQWKQLLKLYGSEEEAWRLIDYLSFKMWCARQQEKNKWKLDVDFCVAARDRLQAEADAKRIELAEAMPKVAVKDKKTKPKKPYKKDGSLSAIGETWFKLLEEHNLPEDYEGVVEVVKELKEPNPGSHDQIKAWLYGLGWIPTTFKYDRDKETGEVRQIPQVQQDKTKGPGLCSSVKKLYVKEPKLEVLDGLSILTHRISVLNGFLDNVDEEGYVQARVQGLTNTLRFKHRVVVNLPGVDKPYGADVRGCLVAPEGYELCGSDMSSLEDRTKQHYMWKYDPAYVKEMMTPDFDPHLDLAQFAGELTKLQVAMHKAKEEDHGGVRKTYKAVNYACVYGAGGPRVAITAGVSDAKGYALVEAYWKRNWSVKAIAEDCVTKTCNGIRWLFNPVSKLWYSLRHDKDKFSTLNQGTGVFCFDTYLKHVMSGGPPIIGQVHDEWIALVRKGKREKMIRHAQEAIRKTNEELMLNRELGMEIQFGGRYSDIH
ncbi:DNA polymerase I [compost metagenome]